MALLVSLQVILQELDRDKIFLRLVVQIFKHTDLDICFSYLPVEEALEPTETHQIMYSYIFDPASHHRPLEFTPCVSVCIYLDKAAVV